MLPVDPEVDRPYDLELFGHIEALPGYADRIKLLYSTGLNPTRNYVIASSNDKEHASAVDPPPCNDSLYDHLYCNSDAYDHAAVFDVRANSSFSAMLRGDVTSRRTGCKTRSRR